MFTFLLIVHALIAASLVIVILMQRSEGGGLTGGSPSGLMTARGAADFLTRATAVLATMFVLSSIFLAVLATVTSAPAKIDTSLVARPGTPRRLGGQRPHRCPVSRQCRQAARRSIRWPESRSTPRHRYQMRRCR